MHKSFLNKGEISLPLASDLNQAKVGWERWHEALADANQDTVALFQNFDSNITFLQALLNCIFGNSPYLTQLIVREPAFFLELLKFGPDKTYQRSVDTLTQSYQGLSDGKDSLMRCLRIAKKRVATTIAIADITGAWTILQVMNALSKFATTAISLATQYSLLEAQSNGVLQLPCSKHPEKDSGLIILGMGKLGGIELNYSSDVDLMILYDPERIVTTKPDDLQINFVRLTRLLVTLLEKHTDDGYVFRTDLRLRPDPGSTPLALPIIGAETYYESLGQNWERAALIKARPIAGDIAAGNSFLKKLSPFVWRKNLDFAAIQDIHSIKRQIHTHKGGDTIQMLGHNVKIGSGGIREIEFFTQTQQLIWGGRLAELQINSTSAALSELVKAKKISKKTKDELLSAYNFLRFLEHRLQMVDDKQTHTLPSDKIALKKFCIFAGYADVNNFCKILLKHLKSVQKHYSSLFNTSPDLSLNGTLAGNLVFTGADVDTNTLSSLKKMGFLSPKTIDRVIRGWHHGRIRATRSNRAQEILTEITPALLREIANQPDPTDTFLKFNSFLERLPAGIQLFAMFQANPIFLNLICEIIGVAPSLAEHLSGKPSIFDAFLTTGFMDPLPPLKILEFDLSNQIQQTNSTEEKLNVARRWNNDRRFQVGVQLLRGLTFPPLTQLTLSNIAEAALRTLIFEVETQFVKSHGKIANSSFALIALGNFGTRELNWNSDLDLIFVYDHPNNSKPSNGLKSLSPSQYFGRLFQRLINAIGTLTEEGALYTVDTRLRPYGSRGPIAVSLDAFKQYYFNDAWTWEYMALTKARIISAKCSFNTVINNELNKIFKTSINRHQLLTDIEDMRQRINTEHGTTNSWGLKYKRGGMIEVDFIVQYLTLNNASNYENVFFNDTVTRIKQFKDLNIITSTECSCLIKAHRLWTTLQTIISLTTKESKETSFSPQLKDILTSSAKTTTFEHLEKYMSEVAGETNRLYKDLITKPAQNLK